jgi:hypothetical protein
MPRVRLTAGRWLVLAAVSGGVCLSPVFVSRVVAAPPGVRRPAAPPAARSGRPAETDARRRDEIELLQRQDAAEALKKHFNIDVDWRATPLDRLVDIRVRAAKAAELQQRLGVSVEWQRYSWIELEALRRTLISFEEYRDGQGGTAAGLTARTPPPPRGAPRLAIDALVQPTFKDAAAVRPVRAGDPDGILRPTFNGRTFGTTFATDPDGVMRPTFAVRPRWSVLGADPDGLIAPTFVPYRPLSSIGDADDLIDPTRPQKGRPVPARW